MSPTESSFIFLLDPLYFFSDERDTVEFLGRYFSRKLPIWWKFGLSGGDLIEHPGPDEFLPFFLDD